MSVFEVIHVRVRLNYATTHYHPLSPTTIYQHLQPPTTSQNISTTTHHQPKYRYHHPPPAKIYPPPPTTTHHQTKYIHHHPPPPTTTQKEDHHPAKGKIYSNITSFWHCFNSFFFFEIRYTTEILCDKVLISSFFKFKISTTFYGI